MLTRLWSEAFKDAGKPREVIIFRPGLNTIRGGQSAQNSIGKSTLLYIIDYAFGGSTFAKTDAVKAKGAGHHKICFTFEFNGEAYHFARHTDEPGFVRTFTDENYTIEGERIELDEFKGWLKRQYNLSYCDASLRQIIGRFFRIKQKALAHPDQPLQGFARERTSAALSVLYQLLRLYDDVAGLQAAADQTTEDWNAVKRTRDLDAFAVHALRDEKAYEKALREEKRLTDEYEANIKGADQEALDFEAAQLTRASELKQHLRQLRTTLGRIQSRIAQLQANIDDTESANVISADIEGLTELFPGINLLTLEEVQRFHKKISTIVSEETLHQLAELRQKAHVLQLSIDEARYQLQATGVPAEISRERLQKSADLSARREIIRQQTSQYKKVEGYKSAKRQAEQALADELLAISQQAANILNPVIAKIDLAVNNHDEDVEPPQLTFSATGKSYLYKLETDDGDGTANKNLIVFDLAMLTLTDLPVVAHDSPIFKNMSDARVEQILRLAMTFNSTNKQIFIAFDKDSQYEGTQVHELIEQSKVIEIGAEEHALYGWTWNKKYKKDQ